MSEASKKTVRAGSGRIGLALAWGAILVTAAGCTEARRARKRIDPKPATAAPASPAPVAPAQPASGKDGVVSPASPDAAGAQPATGAQAPGAIATPRPGLRPDQVKGTATLKLVLPRSARLGAFALELTFDPARFALADPKSEAAMAGYMCQGNLAVPGVLRYNCVGLPSEDRGGLLATLPVQYAVAPPKVSDFTVTKDEVVDQLGSPIPDLAVGLEVSAAPR